MGDEDELWELRRETGVGRSKRRLQKESFPEHAFPEVRLSHWWGQIHVRPHFDGSGPVLGRFIKTIRCVSCPLEPIV